jgi:hypothetical protein
MFPPVFLGHSTILGQGFHASAFDLKKGRADRQGLNGCAALPCRVLIVGILSVFKTAPARPARGAVFGQALHLAAHTPLFREHFVHIDFKDFGEEENLAVNDRGASDFNVGQNLRRDVAAQPLKLLGQLSLGPAPLVAEPDHALADDIEATHDDPNHPADEVD